MIALLRIPLLLLFGASVLAGCKSADRVMFQTPSHRLSSQLPPLEITVDNGPMAFTEGALPEDPLRVFRQEVGQNLMEAADSSRYGYVKLLVKEAEVTRTGRFFQGVQMVTMMVPSLLGLPIEYYRTNVQAEVQILNAQNEVIGTYAGAGRSKVRVAMYHGYSQANAPRLADMQALRLALDQIRPQLEASADTLRQQLLAAGPLQPDAMETDTSSGL
ncbi:hypothetical protein [Hymenobacter canadensis]|uniref:DUF4136 domain-containing protein n=1 Tax=Hymenobacter canadensis TaxID=2999067 RepID=A0ABY7LTB1_9BACT|nr:hypothetical protein [Hymenobacter canadensis]WBA42128.1 hypothetical protein O3303_00900 [Hymenobacter canadensis]